MMFSVRSASITEIGNVRETNEDAILETGNIYAIADGMGGHKAGEVASNLALSVVKQYIEDNIGLFPGEKLVENAIAAANEAVHRKASSSSRYRDMGTTLTVIYREGSDAFLGHVGDSRAYLLRKERLSRLTEDHTFVGELLRDGQITEEEALVHPQKNIVTRALGIKPQVVPDISSIKIEPGDKFLLASDGLFGDVSDEEIKTILSEEDIDFTAKKLVQTALERGGADNISIVVVGFERIESESAKRGEETEETEETEEKVSEDKSGLHPGNGYPAPLPCAEKPRKRRILRLVAILLGIIVFIGLVLGVVYYLHETTYFVGEKDGEIALYHGFPFWGLSRVESISEMKISFLPNSMREKVKGNLEAQSQKDAEETMRDLEKLAETRSVIVPRVLGMKLDEALEKLENAGLVPVPELIQLRNVEPETVTSQKPGYGVRVGRGSKVRIEVVSSAGFKEV
ncbi:MAG: Stp1/IreP family PP2C-type Ser/Thr phosphatase [Actinomycetota bacterium]|nr:Stp1/IreP family PP2C-type Ser/Thr phosphatase [Actinomycetota bacterium]